MKIEKLNDNSLKRRKFLYTLICVVLLLIIISLFLSHAKYKNTQSVQVATGSINYKKNTADLTIMAVYIEQEDGTYQESTDIPQSGYILDVEQSVCNNGAIVEWQNNKLITSNLTKSGTSCYLYFKECVAKDAILANNTVSSNRASGSFSTVYTEDTAGTIFSAEDDYGTTYFFAGKSPNNWVSFASLYWRIIRINGNGTIRLIYNGTSTTITGTGTQISTSAFNSSSGDNAYVGYMYGSTGATTYANTHKNTNSSEIKEVLDTWYTNNLKTSYASYLDGNTGWCGDRTSSTSDSATWPISSNSGGYGTSGTVYGGWARLYNSKIATFTCSQSNDLYTTNGSSNGNGALTNPIGLITMDEVMYAGGFGSNNSNYWLYTKQGYWTMSPYYFDLASYAATVCYIRSTGYLSGEGYVNEALGVRPVINLKADTVFSSGDGTSSNPYVVKTV